MKIKYAIKKGTAALLLAALLFTGCGKESSDGLREVSIVLDWYPNAVHTFLYTAIERGYYEEEGLNVKIHFPANPNDALTMVAAGKADFGIYYPQDLIQAVGEQGARIKSIGALVQSPLNVVLSMKKQQINSPEDLAGKKVGYAGTAISEAMLHCMMNETGADPSNLELIDVGFDLMSSITTGNVDAVIGCTLNHEIPQMEKEGFEIQHFSVVGSGIPNYYESVILTGDRILEEDSELAASFLRASKKGFDDFKEDPRGCLEILLNNQNEENFPLIPSVEEASCEILLPLMETEQAEFLSQSEICWQDTIDWMEENGLLTNEVTVTDVMANAGE